MTRTRFLLLSLALATAAGGAFAQDAAAPGRAGGHLGELQKRFAAADKNGDGKLTRDEAQAMPRVFKHFDEIDKAHAGSVSMADIAAYAKERRSAKQAGG